MLPTTSTEEVPLAAHSASASASFVRDSSVFSQSMGHIDEVRVSVGIIAFSLDWFLILSLAWYSSLPTGHHARHSNASAAPCPPPAHPLRARHQPAPHDPAAGLLIWAREDALVC